MSWHDRLGHLHTNDMFNLVEIGNLPKRFNRLQGMKNKFIFPSCIMGKQTRRPWRTKGKYHPLRKKYHKHPGACISVDQLVSKKPGLIPLSSGNHSSKRIMGATIYLDNNSNFSYTFMKIKLDSEETLESKLAFEI